MPAAGSAHLGDLRAQVRALEQADRKSVGVLPFEVEALDAVLPGGGLALGALHEVAGGGDDAVGGAAAALFAAGVVARLPGPVLWCVTRPDLFAPALSHAGLGTGSRHLCRGRRREGPDGLFRGRPSPRRPRRSCLRNVAPDHDGLTPAPARGRDVGRHRPGGPTMATGRRGGRLRPADRRRDALARQRRAVGAPAGSRHRAGAVADRTHALPRRRRGGLHSGRLR